MFTNVSAHPIIPRRHQTTQHTRRSTENRGPFIFRPPLVARQVALYWNRVKTTHRVMTSLFPNATMASDDLHPGLFKHGLFCNPGPQRGTSPPPRTLGVHSSFLRMRWSNYSWLPVYIHGLKAMDIISYKWKDRPQGTARGHEIRLQNLRGCCEGHVVVEEISGQAIRGKDFCVFGIQL